MLPSLTKYVPMIEPTMHTPPMASGISIMTGCMSPVVKIWASSMVATMVTA